MTRKFDNVLLRYCNTVYNQNTIDRWTKGDLGISKNYRVISPISLATKIYNVQLLNHIEPETEKILRKNQNGFRRNRSTTSQILTICRISEGVRAKNRSVTLLFVDFSNALDSIHRGKMAQTLPAYSLSKKTTTQKPKTSQL